jgi:hypothetical protein
VESVKDVDDAADAIVQINRQTGRLGDKTQSGWLMNGGHIERAILSGRAARKHYQIVAGIVHIPGRERKGLTQLHIASQDLSRPNVVEHAFSASGRVNRKCSASFDSFRQSQAAILSQSQLSSRK